MAGEPYTITITYANGTTSKFTGCTGLVETETKLKFKGKKEGDTDVQDWSITLSNVNEWGKRSEK